MTDEYQWHIQTVDVWPYGVRHVAVRAATPAPEVAVVEVQAVPDQVSEPEPIEVKPIETDATTIANIDGGLNLLGRWLIRFWLRIHVQRR